MHIALVHAGVWQSKVDRTLMNLLLVLKKISTHHRSQPQRPQFLSKLEPQVYAI